MEEQREEGILRVEDAMRPALDPVLDAQETVEQALQKAESAMENDVLVRLSPRGWSSVAKEQLRDDGGRGKNRGEFWVRYCRSAAFLICIPIILSKPRFVMSIGGLSCPWSADSTFAN